MTRKTRRFLVTITDAEPVADVDIKEALAMAAADVLGEAVQSRVDIVVRTYAGSDLAIQPGTSCMTPVPNANACAPGPGSVSFLSLRA